MEKVSKQSQNQYQEQQIYKTRDDSILAAQHF